MNNNHNHKHHNRLPDSDRELAVGKAEELESLATAHALSELDEIESRKLQSRLKSESSLAGVQEETKQLGSLLRESHSAEAWEGKVALIPGLKQQLEEALDSADPIESELPDSKHSLKPKADDANATQWPASRLLAIAASTLLIAGGCWWLMQVRSERPVSLGGGFDFAVERNKAGEALDYDDNFSGAVSELARRPAEGPENDLADGVVVMDQSGETNSLPSAEYELKQLLGTASPTDSPAPDKKENAEGITSLGAPVQGKEWKYRLEDRRRFKETAPSFRAMPAVETPQLADSLEAVTDSVSSVRGELAKPGQNNANLDGRKSGLAANSTNALALPANQSNEEFVFRSDKGKSVDGVVIVSDSSNDSRFESPEGREALLKMRKAMERARESKWSDYDRGGEGKRYDSNEQYELPPENQFIRPLGNSALSTFAIDVDTASYANARRFITQGQLPPPPAVRVEEFVNYFAYTDAGPTDGKPFAVHMEVAGCPWEESHKLLRIGLKGKEVPRDDRPVTNLVFLIDVSGSMSAPNKLALLQRSMMMLVDRLTENDKVSIVTYAGNAGLRLKPTSGDQKDTIRGVIGGLSSGGSTHGSAGIRMAYELAAENFIEEGVNRVILATDGDLNVGVTADDDLVSLIKEKADSGIFLTVLGFGTGNLKDAKLEKLADNGNGQYNYIDTIREARKVLVEEMTGSLITIAKDVKIQVEFNPAEIAGYRLIGYENRALANEDFDNDLVDAGDIGAGHTVTALYELIPVGSEAEAKPKQPPTSLKYQRAAKPKESESKSEPDVLKDMEPTEAAKTGELVAVSLRYKQPQAHESDLIEFAVKDSGTPFDEASENLRFSAAVANFGMKLRRSKYSGRWNFSDIQQAAGTALGSDEKGHRAEFMDLVRQTMRILGQQ